MARAWRQDLTAARRAKRECCEIYGAGGGATPVAAWSYAIRRSAETTRGYAAIRATERLIEIAACPRDLRALKENRVLRMGGWVVSMRSHRPEAPTLR